MGLLAPRRRRIDDIDCRRAQIAANPWLGDIGTDACFADVLRIRPMPAGNIAFVSCPGVTTA